MKELGILFGVLLVFSFHNAYASDEIFITISDTMDQVIFDGKWSFNNQYNTEWKLSSADQIGGDENDIVLRSAHQDDFVYFLIDYVSDVSPDAGYDKATMCFDTQNNKNEIPDADDYCFIAVFSLNEGHTLNGGNIIPMKSYMKKIPNHKDFVGVSGVSDEKDRYSSIPHLSYEFKIPTEVIGRSNVYGFYINVYDFNSDTNTTWPKDIEIENQNQIPSPSKWGELISPDRTLPEFSFSFFFVILILGVATIYAVTKPKFNFKNF